jgi:enterochelin esterase family protein
MIDPRRTVAAAFTAVMLGAAPGAYAQPPAPAPATQPTPAPSGRGPQAPAVVSPEVGADRRITFRIYAPQAQAVRLSAGDIPGAGQAAQFVKAGNGVWEASVGPVDAGAYRYAFTLDGVATIDPNSPFTSESNTRVWSLVYVPGSEATDTRNVPHGAVAEVTYFSTSLNAFRRMHVYTPPGYDNGTAKYPVFYLLHGAGDSDDSWTSVGRAGFILDNLIAARKSRPMVVVMPAGHTSRGAAPGGVVGRPATEAFVGDFTTDVVPYVAKHYRVLTDRANTAIAGLSMGGAQALHIGIPHLEKFAYIGVYSSGLIGAFPGVGRGAAPPTAAATAPTTAPAADAPTASPPAPASAPATAASAPPSQTPGAAPPAPAAATAPQASDWERQHQAKLADAGLKKGLKLFWFGTGKEDFLIGTTKATVTLLEKHGFKPVFKETAGGHTWINWRAYLTEFVPQLFQ